MIKRLLMFWAVIIILYLVLIHYTGFTKDVGELGTVGVNVTKTLQGR